MRSDSGLLALVASFGTAGVAVALSVGAAVAVHEVEAPNPLLAAVAEASPWRPGDALPLWRVLAPTGKARVVEDERDGLVAAEAPVEPEAAPEAAVPVVPAVGVGSEGAAAPEPGAASALVVGTPSAPPVEAALLPKRGPMVPTALVDPDHRGLDAFYRALAARSGLARAAHWGDSTIAADGITGTVRARLQARFGYGGPGYINAGVDPRWSARPDVSAVRGGEWTTQSILLGGAKGRYGYGGVLSTASAGATLSANAPKGPDGARVPLQRLELWYQTGEGFGSWWLSANGGNAGSGSAAGGAGDARHVVDLPAGYTKVAFGATEGPVPFYGVVMETSGPGVVWDALGVVGVGTRSFSYQGKKHVARQVAQRAPELVVLMLGGNELGFPALQSGTGNAYGDGYRTTLRLLRNGAPNAGCLVVTPLDQATREGDAPATKKSLPRLVRQQARIAAEEGCAFWNAFEAMGGEGAIVRWSRMKPPLAWTDLLHLSATGQAHVGEALADAIEAGFDAWSASGGAARPRPPAYVPEAGTEGLASPLLPAAVPPAGATVPVGGALPPPAAGVPDAAAPRPEPAGPAATENPPGEPASPPITPEPKP